MSRDVLPDSDAAVLAHVTGFESYVAANAAALGLTAAEVTELSDALAEYEAALKAVTAAKNMVKVTTVSKNGSRAHLEGVFRPLNQRLKVSPLVTLPMRRALGQRLDDTQPTPGGLPTTIPQLVIDFSQRCRHRLRFFDVETGRRAKPEGVFGCEVWRANITDGEGPDTDFRYVATLTRPGYVVKYDLSEIGQRIAYQARWVNRRGEAGSWGPTARASVAG